MLSAHKIKWFVLGKVIKRCLQNTILEDKHTDIDINTYVNHIHL